MKRNQALKAVEVCAAAWVEFGVSVRDLSWAEAIEARNQQASMREPIAFAELPNVVYRPRECDVAQARQGRVLVRMANQFAAMPA